MREVHALERRSRDVVRAAQVVPNLATAVQEAIYNAVDAHARSVKVWVDVTSGSFSVADDGDGIPPEGLYKYIGECVATSRLVSARSDDDERHTRARYGKRGEFLHALGALASVEIESRIQDQWTAHRKLIQVQFAGCHWRGSSLHAALLIATCCDIQDGAVAFNARSKVFRKGHGTTVTARKLFDCLPVRAKDLQTNPRRCAKLIKEIQTFCVNLSMIWPTLSLELVFESEFCELVLAIAHRTSDVGSSTDTTRQSLRISGVDSCRERFVKVFGSAIGNELEVSETCIRGPLAWYCCDDALTSDVCSTPYVDFSPADSQFAVRGYFALIQDSWEVSSAGLKQARAYYQYVFFHNQWIESFHQECAKRISQLALELNIGIPMFVLKVDCPAAESALLWSENGKCVELKSPDSLDRLLCDLMQTLNGSVESANSGVICEQDTPTVSVRDERDNDFVLHEMQNQVEEANGVRQEYHPDRCLRFSEDEDAEDNQLFRIPQHGNDTETIFLVQDAKTNWGERTPARFTEDEVAPYISAGEGAASCGSCVHANTWRGSTHEDVDGEGWDYEGEYSELVSDCDISPPLAHPHERQAIGIDIDDRSFAIDQEAILFTEEPQQLKAPEMNEGELANVFFAHSKVPKLTRDEKPQAFEEVSEHGNKTRHWITSRSLKTALDGALDSSPPHQSTNGEPRPVNFEDQAKKRLRQRCSKYFRAHGTVTPTIPPPAMMRPRKPRASSMTLPRTSKCMLRVDNVGEPKQLRNVKIPKSVLETLEVIRQVDRKFILVRVADHSSFESLLLCIDQHAADERVKLEQLELELFGPDGDELNIRVSEHAQPQLILLNAKEAQTLAANEDIVRVWGFDFEFVESETSLRTAMEYRDTEGDGEFYVQLRTTPKVDTRCANADDFREFIQILSQNEGFWSWTVMRPPVVTRLLHSRACRSAIMFGDYLSISQCRELVDSLRKCKLPFQCAHGRPSVVPLVEFVSRE